jgi:hypothetical protein
VRPREEACDGAIPVVLRPNLWRGRLPRGAHVLTTDGAHTEPPQYGPERQRDTSVFITGAILDAFVDKTFGVKRTPNDPFAELVAFSKAHPELPALEMATVRIDRTGLKFDTPALAAAVRKAPAVDREGRRNASLLPARSAQRPRTWKSFCDSSASARCRCLPPQRRNQRRPKPRCQASGLRQSTTTPEQSSEAASRQIRDSQQRLLVRHAMERPDAVAVERTRGRQAWIDEPAHAPEKSSDGDAGGQGSAPS